MKIYDTLTKEKVDISWDIKIYSCWPTVYWEPHLGNIRYFFFCWLLQKTLKMYWCNVTHCMNITDVWHLTSDSDTWDDKMEKKAKEIGKTARDVSQEYTKKFELILENMNISFDYLPKATDHIKEQIEMIEQLELKWYTYRTSDWIYMDTSLVKDYWKLIWQKHIDWLQSWARIDLWEKKNNTDFALWKFWEWRDMQRETKRWIWFPWRHIECSAMSKKYLWDIDIHTWWIDHIPIHHTNEIAQSECSCNHKVKYRMHSQFLNIDWKKISKSLWNVVYLWEVLERWYSIKDLNYYFLQAHYRSFQDFTRDKLEQAKKARSKLKEWNWNIFLYDDLAWPKQLSEFHKNWVPNNFIIDLL